MAEILTIFLFFVAMAITAVIFFGWIVITVLRVLRSGLVALFAPAHPYSAARLIPQESGARQVVRCDNRGCGAPNPGNARFCRRCGRGLPAGAAERIQVRRAAVW